MSSPMSVCLAPPPSSDFPQILPCQTPTPTNTPSLLPFLALFSSKAHPLSEHTLHLVLACSLSLHPFKGQLREDREVRLFYSLLSPRGPERCLGPSRLRTEHEGTVVGMQTSLRTGIASGDREMWVGGERARNLFCIVLYFNQQKT